MQTEQTILTIYWNCCTRTSDA